MSRPSQSIATARFRARNVREGIKGAHWWREDLDVVSDTMLARKRREDNLELHEKLGGKQEWEVVL